jgi:hypothetical protein
MESCLQSAHRHWLAICGGANDCGYQPIRVFTPAHFNVSNGKKQAQSSLLCPPACPGQFDMVTNPLVTVLAADGGTLAVPVSAMEGFSSFVFTETSDIGLYVSSSCLAAGFPELAVEVCLNVSNPDSRLCSFGAGSECQQCPFGAVCPGGFRAWPLPGYFSPHERTTEVVPCPAPASRCTGWNVAAGHTKCDQQYEDGSYFCVACKTGYYVEYDGSCAVCPAFVSTVAQVVQIAQFLGIMLACIFVFFGFSFLALKMFGGTLENGLKTLLQLCVWTFTVIQLISQVGRAAGTGMPEALKRMYAVLLVFQFQGATIPSACVGGNRFASDEALFCTSLCVLALLACTYFASKRVTSRLISFVSAPLLLPLVYKAVRPLLMLTIVLYAPVTNAVFDVLVCKSAFLPVRAYLNLHGDGSALTDHGVTLSSTPTRGQLNTMLSVSLLTSDPSQVCWEGQHIQAAALAICAGILHLLAYPTLVFLYIHTSARRVPSIKPSVPTNVGAPVLAKGVSIHRPSVVAVSAPRSPRVSVTSKVAAAASPRGTAGPVQVKKQPGVSPQEKRDADIKRYFEGRVDPILTYFVSGDVRPSCYMFYWLDHMLQLCLSVISNYWESPSSLPSIWLKTSTTAFLLLLALGLYASKRPFAAVHAWKQLTKCMSFVVGALGTITNALVLQSSVYGNVNADTLSAAAYLVVTGSVALLVILAGGFVWSIFRSQQIEREQILAKKKAADTKPTAFIQNPLLNHSSSGAMLRRLSKIGDTISPELASLQGAEAARRHHYVAGSSRRSLGSFRAEVGSELMPQRSRVANKLTSNARR